MSGPSKQSLAALERHRKQRERDLLAMTDWPNGVAPLASLPHIRLRALVSRGLAEVRYHLTPEGVQVALKSTERKP